MSDDLTTAYLLGAEQMRDKLHKQADAIERLQREAAIRLDQIRREQESHLRTIADYNRVAVENDKLKKELEFAIKGVEKYEAIIDSEKELAKDDLSKKLRKALKSILDDATHRDPVRMTCEVSEKVLFEAEGALNEGVARND